MPRKKTKLLFNFENLLEQMLEQNQELAIDAMLSTLRRIGMIRMAATISSVNTLYMQDSGFVDHLDLQMARELGEVIRSEADKTQRDDPESIGYTQHEMTIEVIRRRV